VTDAAGRASAVYRLPTVTGPASVLAEVTGGTTPALFRSTVLPATAVAMAVAGGNGQTDSVTSVLAPFRVTVRDSFGNLAPGAVVSWEVIEGDGQLSSATSVADQSGVAQVVYTLGAAVGTHRVTARLGSGATVSFTATATP